MMMTAAVIDDEELVIYNGIDMANRHSPFVNNSTKWRVQLNFGLEPGSSMPKRFPDWAASGARLGVPVELLFTSTSVVVDLDKNNNIPDYVQGQSSKHSSKNSPPMVVNQVQVSPSLPSTFVSSKGEETVTFTTGGYTMERTSMLNTTAATRVPKPRFLLRFWIDCISGATRKDVTLEPNTRIFGTIPIWDDPDQIANLKEELATIRFQQKDAASNIMDADANASFIDRLVSFFGGRNTQQTIEIDEASLSYRQEQIERLLPLPGSVVCSDTGVTVAPKGSLSMPYGDDRRLIIGAFAMRPVKAERQP